jgi:hydroxypyruvate isomerase
MEVAMERRDFVKSAALAAGAGFSGAAEAAEQAAAPRKGKFHLRYACELDWLKDTMTWDQKLALYSENGFDAIEYNGLLKHPMSEVEELRRLLDKYGMDMGIFVANPGGWDKAGVVDPKQHDNFVAEITKSIEYHKVIKNRSVTTLTGMAMPGVSRSTQRRNCVTGFKRAADLLAGTELALVVEPLNHIDHPGFFMTRADELAEVIAAVNSPNVRMLYDLYHLQVTQGNLIRDFREYYSLIGYIQTGDVPGRKEPGTGEVNYRNVLKAIHEQGYRGIIGCEHGMSEPGLPGLKKLFEAYRQADAWV